jgi:uroporphyrinogen decarboxylase
MTEKTERIRRVLDGELVDRVPFSAWTHFPGIDLDPDRLAEATLAFYRDVDLDFVKSMSNGMFSIEDYGCDCDFSAISEGGVATVTKYAVEAPSDWEKLGDLDIEKGALGRELRSLSRLLDALRGEAPVLATVFSPLTTAQKLSGTLLLEHLRTHPRMVKRGLSTIAACTARFAVRAVELGCAGLYFASQMSQRSQLEEEEYGEFGMPYDLEVLEAVQGGSWFNVTHIHGDDILFGLLKGYPVQGISWHVWETRPSVEEFFAADRAKCIIGGLRRSMITSGNLPELAKNVSEMIRITGGRRLMLAPGCVVRAPYDKETLRYLRRTIDRARGIGS